MLNTRFWAKNPGLSAGIAVALLAGLLAVPSSPAFAQDAPAAAPAQDPIAALKNLGNAFADITAATSPAVVFIRYEKRLSPQAMGLGQGGQIPDDFFERFFGAPGQPMPEMRQAPPEGDPENSPPVPVGQGSGFIIREDGYIITNHHVVDGADNIAVQLDDGREFDATIVGSDAETEIAVIKIDATGLPTLPLGDSDSLRVGELVLAIGNPFGLSHSVTAGIVSARGRSDVGLREGGLIADFIQTDAAINPGNSGGPLLNLDGQAVGLNTAILSRSGGYMGIGFAIPINMVKYVSEQLIANGKVTRGFLGIQIQDFDAEMSNFFKGVDQGVLVSEVIPDTPAAAAEIQREDVIVALNGQPVKTADSFKSRVSIIAPGQAAELTIMRNGEKIIKSVTVAAFPDDLKSGATRVEKGVSKSDSLGISVQDLSPELAERFGFQGVDGVVITQVDPNSPASLTGLIEGMLVQEVNRKPIKNVEEFNAALEENTSERAVLLRVRENDVSRYVTIKINR
jgi:serine protease Do